MPQPVKVTELPEDESLFEPEKDEEPTQPRKRHTEVVEEPPEDEALSVNEPSYDEIVPDFDGPEGTTFSLSLLTDEDGDMTACLSIDFVTIDLPLDDYLTMMAELRSVEANLRRLSKG